MRALPAALILVGLMSPWAAIAQEPDSAELAPALDYDETTTTTYADEPEDNEASPPATPPVDMLATIQTATTARAAEFEQKGYVFCRDPDYEPKFGRQRAFCKVVDDDMLKVCPEAKRICEGEEEEKTTWKLPEEVNFALMALLIALGGVAVIYLFFSILRARVPEAELDLSTTPTRIEDLVTLPEAPAVSILRKARERLDAGAVAEAAGLLHIAVLRHLEDRGLVRFHPSTTNGEYLRKIRSQRELYELYRKVAGQTDRLRFGDGQVDRTVVETAIADAQAQVDNRGANPFASTASIFLVLAISSSALWGCTDLEPSFYSHSPDGLAALPRLLSAGGIDVEVVKQTPDEIPEDTGLIVARTDRYTYSGNVEPWLDAWLDRGYAIVILDDANELDQFLPVTSSVTISELMEAPDPVDLEVTPEYICGLDQVLLGDAIAPASVRGPAHRTMEWDGIPAKPLSSRYLMTLVPVLVRKSNDPYRSRVLAYSATRLGDDGEPLSGCLFVFSSSAVFSNASLTREANLRYAVGFLAGLARKGEKVLFVDAFSEDASKSSGIAGSLAKTHMLPFILHAGLLTALLLIALGAAFGPLRDHVTLEHKAFVEHVEAVGRHYASAGEAGLVHAGQAMARLVVARYRHQVRGGTAGAWQGLAKDLAEKFEIDPGQVLDALCLGLEGSLKDELMRDRSAGPIGDSVRVLSTILSRGGSLGARTARDGGKQKWI